MSPYERLVRASGQAAYGRLLALGFFIVVLAELVLTARGVEHYWVMELCYAAWLCTLPCAVVLVRLRWIAAHERLLGAIKLRTMSGERWIDENQYHIFGVTRYTWPTAWSVAVTAGATILYQPSPYGDLVANGVAFLVFEIVFFMAGHFLYMVFQAMHGLDALVNSVRSGRFLGVDAEEIRQFENVWLAVAALVSYGYGLILMATAASPYVINAVVAAWLWIGSVVPLVTVFFNLLCLRRLRMRLKEEQARLLVEAIDEAVRRDQGGLDSLDGLQRIAALGGILQQVQATRGWPLAVTVANSVFIGTLPVAIQAIQVVSSR